MPGPISLDLRKRAIAAWEAGEGTQAEIGTRFAVGEASIRRWVARKRRAGTLEPKAPDRTPTRRIDAVGEVRLRELVSAQPDASEEELVALYEEAVGTRVGRSTINRALNRMGLTRKKRPSLP